MTVLQQTEFPVQVNNEIGHPEAIKWSIAKEKYEIHQATHEHMEIGDILTHCL
jgi:ribosomal protein S17